MLGGMLMFTTLTVPQTPVNFMSMLPTISMWKVTVGILAWDMWNLQDSRRTVEEKFDWTGNVIAHAASLGGAAFGQRSEGGQG
jgi:hypothetical protein